MRGALGKQWPCKQRNISGVVTGSENADDGCDEIFSTEEDFSFEDLSTRIPHEEHLTSNFSSNGGRRREAGATAEDERQGRRNVDTWQQSVEGLQVGGWLNMWLYMVPCAQISAPFLTIRIMKLCCKEQKTHRLVGVSARTTSCSFRGRMGRAGAAVLLSTTFSYIGVFKSIR